MRIREAGGAWIDVCKRLACDNLGAFSRSAIFHRRGYRSAVNLHRISRRLGGVGLRICWVALLSINGFTRVGMDSFGARSGRCREYAGVFIVRIDLSGPRLAAKPVPIR